MAESNAQGLPWPTWYELPPIPIRPGCQDWEIKLDARRWNRLGKYHLRGLYPVEYWPEYWVDRETDDYEMERFWHDYHRTVTAIKSQPDARDIYPHKITTSNVSSRNLDYYEHLY
jgi:hypothetical protein